MVDLGDRVLGAPFGRNPYEHGKKSASKIGSSTSFSAVWTTRSATVGTAVSYCLSCSDGLGLSVG